MTNTPKDQTTAAGAGSSSTPGGEPAKAEQTQVGPLAPGQRWSVARKREVVLRLLRLRAELAALEQAQPAGVVQSTPAALQHHLQGIIEKIGLD